MQNVIKCIYPKITRIPQNYSCKSLLKSELYENKGCNIHILNVICGSSHLNYSPYDSALVLNLLLDNLKTSSNSNNFIDKNKVKNNIKIKSHSLYKPAITRIIDSVINYRIELFPYFFKKFSELNEVNGLRSIIFVIVDSNCLPNYNINALIDLCYLTSFQIPSGCFSDKNNSDYILYNKFYKQLLDNIIKFLNNNHLNKVLLYKLYFSIARIPFQFDFKILFKLTFDKLKEVLSNNSWESKYLIQIYYSLFKLDLLHNNILELIYRNIELVLYDLNPKDLNLLLSVTTKLNDSLSIKLSKIANERILLYNKLNVVQIPGKALVALSKTHPLYQNDKAILSDDAAELIASTVEMRLKQILEVAKILMNNSARPINSNVLVPEDIRNALIALNIPDLDGYSNSYEYRYVWATKLFKGNRVIKRESCYKTVGEKSWGRYRLSQLVKQDLQKPVPAAPGLTVSWSVVDGRVPMMSNGFVEDITKEYENRIADSLIKEKLGEISFVDYSEAEEKLDSINSLVKDIKVPQSELTSDFSNNFLDRALLDAINKQIVQDKNLVKNQKFVIPKVDYLLTKEHKFFLKEIKNMLKRASFSLEPDIQMQYKKVTEILRTSLGLDQLLPELCYLFTTEITRFKSNQSSFNLNILLQYVEALTSNQNIQIHHYVHQLLIPLLEILLSSDNDMNPINIYRSLVLRKLAAQCIYNISYNLKRNNNGLESIDSYLMNLYKNEITNDQCSLSVLYGSLCGIAKLPVMAKRVVFYPMVPLLLNVVLKKQNRLQYYSKNKQKQRLQAFKQILLHEILHLLLEIIYDSSFEDILSTLENTGSLLTESYEANLLVNDVLMGCINSSINPELLLQLYVAILNKCYTLLSSLNENNVRLKRKFDEVTGSDMLNENGVHDSGSFDNSGMIVNMKDSKPRASRATATRSEGQKKHLPEVVNIKNYHKLYNKANDSHSPPDTVVLSDIDNDKSWYNFNGIHSLTLTI